MAAVIRELYHFLFYKVPTLRDPRTINWFMAGEPWALMFILTAYWLFVFKIGPAYMKNRPPFKIDRIIQVYNAIQVIVCAYLVYEGLEKAYGPWGKYNFFCEPVDTSFTPRAISIARSVHIYYILKILDLLDTVFFVLRKKQSQVTFLHVYHHMGMTVFGYFGASFLPGGQGVMLGLVNCFVHTVMYTYYFLTIWNSEYKKYIWWKKHITQLQIMQFLVLFLHNSMLTVYPDCGYPWWSSIVLMPQFFFFFLLFSDFYYRTYFIST